MSKLKTNLFSQPTDAKDARIAEEAIVWFTRMQSEAATKQDKIRFHTWKSQSEAHERAYEEAEALWVDPDFNQALALSNLSYDRGKMGRKHSSLRIHKLQNKWLPLSLAASSALFVVLADPLTRIQADYYTPVGGKQTIQLSDGSSITLNTDSAITVAYTDNSRRIRLLKGEAYFDVQHDETKPFIIDSGNTETRVLGTQFLVQDGRTEDKVTVIKGLVKVSNRVNQQSVVLHKDEQVSNQQSGLTAIRQIKQQRESGWLKGRLAFQDATLGEVVSQMGRYLPGVIVFADNALKTYRINARFDISQPKVALTTLEETLPISIAQISPWLTVIRHR